MVGEAAGSIDYLEQGWVEDKEEDEEAWETVYKAIETISKYTS